MADLRDNIHKAKDDLTGLDDHQLFLAYHANSFYAMQKVAAGLRLTPEARKYMMDELARRKRLEDAFLAEVEKDKERANAEDAQRKASQPAPTPDGQREHTGDGIRGNGSPDPGNGPAGGA